MDVRIHPTIACAFATDDAAVAASRALADGGMTGAIRIAATDAARAAAIAQRAGASAVVDANDPLAGVAGLATGDDAASGVNRGAVIGGACGLVVGLWAGASSFGALIPVEPSYRLFAAAALL